MILASQVALDPKKVFLLCPIITEITRNYPKKEFLLCPIIAKPVTDFVRACPLCQRTKTSRRPTPENMPLPVPDRPYQMITLDWFTGFPTNTSGHDGVLVKVDKFST
jgi:hypothetical protein